MRAGKVRVLETGNGRRDDVTKVKQPRINFTLTRSDAATLLTVMHQIFEDETYGMLTPENAAVVDRLAGRLNGLLERQRLPRQRPSILGAFLMGK